VRRHFLCSKRVHTFDLEHFVMVFLLAAAFAAAALTHEPPA